MSEDVSDELLADLAAERGRKIAELRARNAELVDAAENLIIAIGMGWDLDGVIDVTCAAITRAKGEA